MGSTSYSAHQCWTNLNENLNSCEENYFGNVRILNCVLETIAMYIWGTLGHLIVNRILLLYDFTCRSTATGVLTGVGRIASILGNLTFGALVTSNCAVPMLLVATLLGGGGLLSLRLPNYTSRDLIWCYYLPPREGPGLEILKRLSVRPSVCPSFRTVTRKRIAVFSRNFAGMCTMSWGCVV